MPLPSWASSAWGACSPWGLAASGGGPTTRTASPSSSSCPCCWSARGPCGSPCGGRDGWTTFVAVPTWLDRYVIPIISTNTLKVSAKHLRSHDRPLSFCSFLVVSDCPNFLNIYVPRPAMARASARTAPEKKILDTATGKTRSQLLPQASSAAPRRKCRCRASARVFPARRHATSRSTDGPVPHSPPIPAIPDRSRLARPSYRPSALFVPSRHRRHPFPVNGLLAGPRAAESRLLLLDGQCHSQAWRSSPEGARANVAGEALGQLSPQGC